MDVESRAARCVYTEVCDAMIKATDSDHAPWYRVSADDKRSARLNCISHLLSMIPQEMPPLPKRRKRSKGVPVELAFAYRVPEIYWGIRCGRIDLRVAPRHLSS